MSENPINLNGMGEFTDIRSDQLAVALANKFRLMMLARQARFTLWTELHDFAMQTDTSDTSNATSWKNNIAVPVIPYILDVLTAQYYRILFPQKDWFEVVPHDILKNAQKAKFVKAYLLRQFAQLNVQPKLREVIRETVLYGNSLCGFVEQGGKLVFVKPPIQDWCRDVFAQNFDNSFLACRFRVPYASLFSLYPEDKVRRMGDIYKDSELYTSWLKNRNLMIEKYNPFLTDRLNQRGFAELIYFYGDFYNEETQEILKDRLIIVGNGTTILYNEECLDKPFVQAQYRETLDDGYGTGLENLTGIAWHINKLQNNIADVMDIIANPICVVKSENDVKFNYVPNAQIQMSREDSIEFISPDHSVLNQYKQIDFLFEMAKKVSGAQEEKIGQRQPGEKTATEVTLLSQGADNLFEHFAKQFEYFVIIPLLKKAYRMFVENVTKQGQMPFTYFDQTSGMNESIIFTAGELDNMEFDFVGASQMVDQSTKAQQCITLLELRAKYPEVHNNISGAAVVEQLIKDLGVVNPNIFKPGEGIEEDIRMAIQQSDAQKRITSQRAVLGHPEPQTVPQPARAGNP